MESFDADSNTWEAFPLCSEELSDQTKEIIQSFGLSLRYVAPGTLELCPGRSGNAPISGQFQPFRVEDINPLLGSVIVFRNRDLSYQYWCETTERIGGPDNFVTVIRGMAPKTPYGLFDPIKVRTLKEGLAHMSLPLCLFAFALLLPPFCLILGNDLIFALVNFHNLPRSLTHGSMTSVMCL